MKHKLFGISRLIKKPILACLTSLILAALGILLLLKTDTVGGRVLDGTVAALLFFYLALFLCAELRRGARGARLASAVEFSILAFFMLALILRQFTVNVLAGISTCRIIGIFLWLRGISLALRSYFTPHTEEKRNAPFLLFCFSLALITLGASVLVKPLVSDRMLVYGIAALLIALALILFSAAVACAERRPKKKASPKTKDENTEK
jgi:hypothetical protein